MYGFKQIQKILTQPLSVTVLQAKKNMGNDKFSSSHKLKSLLTNLTANPVGPPLRSLEGPSPLPAFSSPPTHPHTLNFLTSYF